MSTLTNLKGVTEYGEAQFSSQIETNLRQFFNWGFLGIGGFYNVVIPSSGAYGGTQSRLRPVRDNDFTDGCVWEGPRQDWVWESGVEYARQPIQVSGVYVGGTFYPSSTTGAYAHYIDYPQGRVVFNSPINTASVVTAEYSYRAVQFTTADEAPWVRELMFNSMRVDDTHYLQQGSGSWDILAKKRVQLPCVVIESVDNVRCRPFEIGSQVRTQTQDVLCHVFAEKPWDKKQIHDILVDQYEKRLDGFDLNLVRDANALPLDYRGSPKPPGVMYPQMIAPTGDGGFKWTQLRLVDVHSTNQEAMPPLYWSTIRYTVELELP
ncbi:MAG: hypothetical protein K2R98_19555 [Gemmataceae bacterium]|nr:hypothetical protein [Gemmataceae bacterium]